jgi:hypothetical protein
MAEVTILLTWPSSPGSILLATEPRSHAKLARRVIRTHGILSGMARLDRSSSLYRIEMKLPAGALRQGLLERLSRREPEDERRLGGELALEVAG